MEKILIQYYLTQNTRAITVWLDRVLAIGDEVTVKNGPEGWWKVERIFNSTTLTELDKKRKWNNNI